MLNRIDKLDPEYGFYRLYNYNFSLQASTIIYGRYEAKKKKRARYRRSATRSPRR